MAISSQSSMFEHMEADIPSKAQSSSSLFLERRDPVFSVHSKYTVFRRMLHIFCLVSATYALGYATVQFNSLINLQPTQSSAMGTDTSRFAMTKRFAAFFANQWASPEFQDQVEQQAILSHWYALDHVLYAGVYSQSGLLVEQQPSDRSMRDIIADNPNAIVATATFGSEIQNGSVVLIVDDAPFSDQQTQSITYLTKGGLALVLLGFIAGAYGFRSFRQLKQKALK